MYNDADNNVDAVVRVSREVGSMYM